MVTNEPQKSTYGPVTPVFSYMAVNHSFGINPKRTALGCSGTLGAGKLTKSLSGASCGYLFGSCVAADGVDENNLLCLN